MADEDLRKLERRASGGDPEAQARLLVERLRSGTLARERLELAAFIGHEPARAALGDLAADQVTELPHLYHGLRRYGKEAWLRAMAVCLSGARERCAMDEARAYAARVLEKLEAWFERSNDEQDRGGRDPSCDVPQIPYTQRLDHELVRLAQGMARALRSDWNEPRDAPICSGLTPEQAERALAAFKNAGALVRVELNYAGGDNSAWFVVGGVSLVLEETGPKQIAVIKEIRKASHLTLKEAKALSEQPGAVICSDLSSAEAERLADRFSAAKAVVRVVGETRPPDPALVHAPAEGLTLILEDHGSWKIATIREIRAVTGLGLKESKEIADRAGGGMCPAAILFDPDLIAAVREVLLPWVLR